MITVRVEDKAIKKLLADMPKLATRAAEKALDATAGKIKDELVAEMRRVFSNPVPYTLNSLKVTRTKNHNMQASVWFKEPDRMGQHYLEPQVEGTERKLKGFERGLLNNKFIPSRYADLNSHGNINAWTYRQILSVLGRAELAAGYQANITTKSAKRNLKERDFVFLHKGSGKLPPGIYRRVIAAGKQVEDAASKRLGLRGAKAYQYGSSIGKFKSIVRASGLKPVLLIGRQHAKIQPRLKFYEIGRKVYADQFVETFLAAFNSLVSK